MQHAPNPSSQENDIMQYKGHVTITLMNMMIIGVARNWGTLAPDFSDNQLFVSVPKKSWICHTVRWCKSQNFFLMQNFFWPLWHLGSRLGLFAGLLLSFGWKTFLTTKVNGCRFESKWQRIGCFACSPNSFILKFSAGILLSWNSGSKLTWSTSQ